MNSCVVDTYGISYAAFWMSIAAVLITFVLCVHRENMAKTRKDDSDG